MYAMLACRKRHPDRLQETVQRAASEFFPKRQQAPSLIGFSLIADENGSNTAIAIWENQARADAFQQEAESWEQTLEQLGHRRERTSSGEVVEHITANT